MTYELEKDKIQAFLQDKLICAIIKKVFKETTEKFKPVVSPEVDDEVLGQKYRAYEYAKFIIEEGFKELESYEEIKTDKESFNKAR